MIDYIHKIDNVNLLFKRAQEGSKRLKRAKGLKGDEKGERRET